MKILESGVASKPSLSRSFLPFEFNLNNFANSPLKTSCGSRVLSVSCLSRNWRLSLTSWSLTNKTIKTSDMRICMECSKIPSIEQEQSDGCVVITIFPNSELDGEGEELDDDDDNGSAKP